MAHKKQWNFSSFDALQDKWHSGQFSCDDVADLRNSIWLDWCSRLDDWAPKVAVCFNRNTGPVTLDRIAQHEMSELRRLACYHCNCSAETLERLLEDTDPLCRDSAREQLEKKFKGYAKKSSPRRKKARA